MLHKEQIDKILEPTIEGLGFEYICSEIANVHITSPKAKHKASCILRLYIDKPGGITLDDCTSVSKHVNRVLDVEGGMDTKYNLEVSSPGLDRPLVKLSHFEQFKGKKVKIKLNLPVNDKRNLTGFIKEVKENTIVIQDLDFPEVQYDITLGNIGKANLVPEWN